MDLTPDRLRRILGRHQPFDVLPGAVLDALVGVVRIETYASGDVIYDVDEPLAGLFLLYAGSVDVISRTGDLVSQVAEGDVFGERGLLREGLALNRAVAALPTTVIVVPKQRFGTLLEEHEPFRDFFDKSRRVARGGAPQENLLSIQVGDLMTRNPRTVVETTTAREAAVIMRDLDISCLLVTRDDRLCGILTTGDMGRRVVAEGRSVDTPVGEIMTADPFTLGSTALGFDALNAMTERGIIHLPIVDRGQLVGIVTSSNLVRQQQVSTVYIIGDIEQQTRFEDLASSIARIPELLVQLVGAGASPSNVGRIITSVADALTRRLLVLAEQRLGPPPVPYLWLACGSQGRSEQTGISDQDNCLILDPTYDATAHGAYFEALAKFVSDGLDAAGYYFCPGEMMATNPRWRQPVKVWRQYFRKWIDQPDPMAQMLASVMFDLRPIAGDERLFHGLQRETLEAARKNSIFRAHMTANSLKHQPPLGLFRGFALIRSGEHKNTLDLKLNGVVPIVDLARLYALQGAIEEVNTRARLVQAKAAGVLSEGAADDLIDAYDLIAGMRLEHQAQLVREGKKPDNFMAPSTLSALERNHLKDAFGVVKALQSALSHGRSAG
ncbi:MAG: cyclic nucleotide-binding/CBS domain-containing protein [Geminicoccaceae bacterium]|nr:MAG: cyclic nucleotide-binding/CBS domain-containing protein [Geminicoccaceae bacterium]